MRGFIIFYVNKVPNVGDQINQDVDNMVNIFKNHNKELIENLKSCGYDVAFVPCVKEGTRVEKIEFDKQWPPIYPPPVMKPVLEEEDDNDD